MQAGHTAELRVLFTLGFLLSCTALVGAADNYALLIAGSSGWGNYRHQADVSHAYQIVRKAGIKEDNIVTMMFDDIARNPMNPHPNQIFNAPGGPNVYEGVKIDYKGSAVTAANFLAVLAGNRSAVTVSPEANGRVLESGPDDHVFVFYSDHGAPGIVGMPSGGFLFADQWITVLKQRSGVGFGHMVIYLEACESGSMFDGLLPDNITVYATTAANGQESSWGTYCPGMNPGPPPELLTCLGDLYSVSWMEDVEEPPSDELETLKKQFQLVRDRTSQGGSYIQGSHVMRFGNTEMDRHPVVAYIGDRVDLVSSTDASAASVGTASGTARRVRPSLQAVPQREADLVSLRARVAANVPSAEPEQAACELAAELASRAQVDSRVARAVYGLTARRGGGGAARRLAARWLGLGSTLRTGLPPPELILTSELPYRQGRPVVDDWDCLRGMISAWEDACGKLDQYGMRHSRAFVNLCNAGVPPEELTAVVAGDRVCAAQAAE